MKVLITGGAGFIGSNAARRQLERGNEVVIVDNLVRPGSEKNLNWLSTFGELELARVDIRDAAGVLETFRKHSDADLVLHLAAQVAVTTSVQDPRADFEVNALGTFNVLEAMRVCGMEKTPILYSSTNKVYGGMEEVGVSLQGSRYGYADLPRGVSEEFPLDFHSPYGCSKGSADQYVRDYHRIYGFNSVVFRQSCIYGYRQFGAEDQGWVAWFMIATQLGRPITIYGDGMQVRDLLFVEDLLDAYDAAYQRIDRVAGRVYNVGGGPSNVLSLLELVDFLKDRQKGDLPYATSGWRPGDQRVFVSNICRAQRELGWYPKTSCSQGLNLLYDWVAENRGLFA